MVGVVPCCLSACLSVCFACIGLGLSGLGGVSLVFGVGD